MKKSTSPDIIAFLEKINWNDYKTKHSALTTHLKNGIKEGIIKNDMPSSRLLATIFGVNRNTITKVLDEMVWEGWLESQPQKGYTINPQLAFINENKIEKQYKLPYKIAKPQLYILPELKQTQQVSFEAFTRNWSQGRIKTKSATDVYDYLAKQYNWTTLNNKLHFVRNAFDSNYLISRLLLQQNDAILVSKNSRAQLLHHLPNLDTSILALPIENNTLSIKKLQAIFEQNKSIKFIYLNHQLDELHWTPIAMINFMELCYRFGVIIWENINYCNDKRTKNNSFKTYDYKHYVITCVHNTLLTQAPLSYIIVHEKLSEHIHLFKKNMQIELHPIPTQFHLHYGIFNTAQIR